MSNRPMICARCAVRRWWPRDFPNTSYAICYLCAANVEHQAIEQRTVYFFFGLFLLAVLVATVASVSLAFC